MLPISASLPDPAADSKVSNASPKLQHAAQEFEAALLSSIWKSMKDGFGPGSDNNKDDSGAGADSLQDIGIQALCSGVSAGGGFGIAAMLLKNVAQNRSAQPEPAQVAQK